MDLVLFSVEKVCVIPDVIFIGCTIIDNSSEPINMWEF